MKVGPDKVATTIAFYKEDWEYMRWLATKTGQSAGAFVRELTHEVVAFMRESMPEGSEKGDLDVRRFLRITFSGLSDVFDEMEKLLQAVEGYKKSDGHESEP